MATVTAASISVSDSLERFRQEFNTLRSDVSNITSGTITINNESNNRILTSVSTNTFNAESGLTYDGSTFAVSGAVTIVALQPLVVTLLYLMLVTLVLLVILMLSRLLQMVKLHLVNKQHILVVFLLLMLVILVLLVTQILLLLPLMVW